MTAVLHVLDSTVDESQLQVLGLLHQRFRAQGDRHDICCIDGPTAMWAEPLLGSKILRAPRRLLNAMNWSRDLAALADQCGAEIIHAWGIEAARVCTARLSNLPLVLTLLDPAATRDVARWVQSFPRSATVATGSQVIHSRLLAAGLPSEQVVVIRGGVDFAAINAARNADTRRRLVGDARPVILMHGPPSRGGGQYYGLWSAAIVAQLHRGLRVVLPYRGHESLRLQRFVRQIKMADMLVVPESGMTWAQLVACADVLVAPAVEEVCTEPIAWAMAAGVVVVASAVRSIAELIADKHNGLLCKAHEPRTLSARILTALEDADLCRRVTDQARAQAYEVFGMRDFVDNYRHLYDNLRCGRPAARCDVRVEGYGHPAARGALPDAR